MQGTLTTAYLPDLLRTIYTQRRTGVLILTQGDVRKQVFFELGQIVFASSTRNEDRLGETLVRHGKLSREQLTAFLDSLESGQHLGNALVERDFLNNRELISYVNFQIIDIIYSLFSWTTGAYEFAQGEEYMAPEDLKLKFSTATVILEGVRRIEDYEVIRRGLGDLNRLIIPTEFPLLRLQTIVLKPVEHRILELVKQPTDIVKILVSTNETAQKTLKSLYGLLSIGLLRQAEVAELSETTGKMEAPESLQQRAAAALPASYTVRSTEQIARPAELSFPEPSSTPVTPASIVQNVVQNIPQNDAPLDLERVKRDISLIKDRVSSQDAKVVFGLSPEPSEEEIRNAYYRLATKFHPDKFIQAPRQIREDIDYIFSNLTKLYNRLQQEMPNASLPPINLSISSAALPRPASLQSSSSSTQSTPSSYKPTYQQASSPYQVAPPPSDYQIPASSNYQPPKYPASGYVSPNLSSPAANYMQPSFAPPTNPSSLQNNSPNRGTMRPISDEQYGGMQMQKFPQRTLPRLGKIDIEGALNDLFDYLEDRKAPLFVADSLSSLLRTKPPTYIEQANLVEAVVSWARQKVSFTGRSLSDVLLFVVSAIKHAEQARVLQDFEPQKFYGSFIQELARYCPQNEVQNFLAQAGQL